MSRLRLFALLWTLLLLVSFIGCNGADQKVQDNPGAQVEIGRRGGRVVVAQRDGPKTFNYLLSPDVNTITTVMYQMTSRLFEFNHDTQEVAPSLAESWKTADDGTSMTIKLRQGVAFSDGAPFTADDVVFTFQLFADTGVVNSPFRSVVMVDDKPITAEKIDPHTVKLNFPAPVVDPEMKLNVIGILPKHKLEPFFKQGAEAFRAAWSVSAPASEIVGLGPFILKEFAPGQRTILARNPRYWKKDSQGNQLPYLDELIFEVVSNPSTRLLKVQSGELDISDEVTPDQFETLKSGEQTGEYRVRDLGPWLTVDLMWFNLNSGEDSKGRPYVDPAKLRWFSNARFRRAVMHAIDRQSIVNNILRGHGTVLHSIVSPANKRWANPDVPRYEYNLNAARQLLKEAGFVEKQVDGRLQLVDAGGRSVEFTLITQEEIDVRKKMAAIIQEDLAKIGIKMGVSPLPNSEVIARQNNTYEYEAILSGLSPSDTAPSAYANVLQSSSSAHWWFPSQKAPASDWEAKIDQMVDRLSRTRSVEERKKIFDEVQKIVAEQLPMLPVVTRNFMTVAKTSVGNYRPSVIIPRSVWNSEELFVREAR